VAGIPHAVLGEDIGIYGGTHLVTDGLLDKFGPKRVMDTPIAEGGFTGAAIGMAMLGMRPIVEMMTWNFSFQAADQIIQNAAKLHYFSGGQVNVPLVIRGPNGGGSRALFAPTTRRAKRAAGASMRSSTDPSTLDARPARSRGASTCNWVSVVQPTR